MDTCRWKKVEGQVRTFSDALGEVVVELLEELLEGAFQRGQQLLAEGVAAGLLHGRRRRRRRRLSVSLHHLSSREKAPRVKLMKENQTKWASAAPACC